MMRPRSSSRRRNTSASDTVTVTVAVTVISCSNDLAYSSLREKVNRVSVRQLPVVTSGRVGFDSAAERSPRCILPFTSFSDAG